MVVKNGTKNDSSTKNKIITSRWILVFKVSKRPSWHEDSHGAKIGRFGLAGFGLVCTSKKLKILDKNRLQTWAWLPLTNLWDIWIYVSHIPCLSLVWPLLVLYFISVWKWGGGQHITPPPLPPTIKLSPVDRFWSSRCLNECLEVYYQMLLK